MRIHRRGIFYLPWGEEYLAGIRRRGQGSSQGWRRGERSAISPSEQAEDHGILPVTRGGRRGARWRDGMNSHPHHPPAGGRAHPVKRSQHPAREHGVSGGGGRKPAGTTTRGCRRDSSL